MSRLADLLRAIGYVGGLVALGIGLCVGVDAGVTAFADWRGGDTFDRLVSRYMVAHGTIAVFLFSSTVWYVYTEIRSKR